MLFIELHLRQAPNRPVLINLEHVSDITPNYVGEKEDGTVLCSGLSDDGFIWRVTEKFPDIRAILRFSRPGRTVLRVSNMEGAEEDG